MPFTLSRSVKSPSLDTVCPKHFTLALQNWHFSLDTYVPLKLTSKANTGRFGIYQESENNSIIYILY